jgi:hypothetical protein
MRGLIALVVTTTAALAGPVVAVGAPEPVGGCPTGDWTLIRTQNDQFLEDLDRNGDGFICSQAQKSSGVRHSGHTVTDNNRRS